MSETSNKREKEIEREFLAEERRIDKVSSCSVSELKKTLRDLNNKNKELNEVKWKNEQLNQQVTHLGSTCLAAPDDNGSEVVLSYATCSR